MRLYLYIVLDIPGHGLVLSDARFRPGGEPSLAPRNDQPRRISRRLAGDLRRRSGGRVPQISVRRAFGNDGEYKAVGYNSLILTYIIHVLMIWLYASYLL